MLVMRSIFSCISKLKGEVEHRCAAKATEVMVKESEDGHTKLLEYLSEGMHSSEEAVSRSPC